MQYAGVRIAIGWKSKLKVVKGVSIRTWSATFNKESLSLDEPLVDDFMAARDYESFKRFCKEYGLIMLRDMISDVTVKRANLKGASHTFDGREAVVAEAELEALWIAIERRINALQDDVRTLQQEQKRDSAAFMKHLSQGLKSVSVEVLKLNRKEKKFTIVLHGKSLKSALYLQIILAGKPLAQCEGCANVFLRTRPDRRYCSTECQASSHKRQLSGVLQRRAQVRARFYRLRDKNPERAEKIKDDVLADLREARTKKDFENIEKEYGLQRQSLGRRPASSTGDKLK